MNSDIYTNSIQLDELVAEKLKTYLKNNEGDSWNNPELINEVNSLRYLLYIVNQDRKVKKYLDP